MFQRENEALGRLSQMMVPSPLHSPAIVGGSVDDEIPPRRDDRVPQWSQQETRDFIGVRGELERDFSGAKRNKTLWEIVAAKMKEKGYRRTPDQCKCKWKNLATRYKGKETSDPDNGRHCPFFEELHALFTARAKNMQRSQLESEAGSVQSKKRFKGIGGGQSSEEFSEEEDEDDESELGQMPSINPQKRRKLNREKQLGMSAGRAKPPSRLTYTTGNTNDNSASDSFGIQGILGHFFQQQQMIDMQWRESMEKCAYERQLFEQEWRQSMERLERERMVIEKASREREEERRIREESRAEKRDALLTTLLNKLIYENHL